MDLTIDMLLRKRDYDNMAVTRKILELFSGRLTEAIKLLTKMDRDIKWYRVESFNPVENYIIVQGEMETQVGDTLQTADGPVLIDESNKKRYSNTVRYCLNASILQSGTVEAIYQHVAFVDAIAREMSEEDIIRTLRSGVVNENAALENLAISDVMEKLSRPTTFESFDTSNLTEEQYISLRSIVGTMEKKVH